MVRANPGWLVAGIVWLGAVGGAAAQPNAEQTLTLRRDGSAPCTVAVRGDTAITLRCPDEAESRCTVVGFADVVPGASVEQIATCEGTVVVLSADGAPLGGRIINRWAGVARVSVLDAIVDDSDELVVRTTLLPADEDPDAEGDDEYVGLFKWRNAELVPVYDRWVHTSEQAFRVEIALSGVPRIVETLAQGMRLRRPTVLTWSATSFRFERARRSRAAWTEPVAERLLSVASVIHQSRASVTRAGDGDCTLAVEGSLAVLECAHVSRRCTVTVVADLAPEPGVERLVACSNDPNDGVFLVLVSEGFRTLWTYHADHEVTARAVDVVPGDGHPALLVEDRAACPTGQCGASRLSSWRVMRWRDGALEPVLSIAPNAADDIALVLRSDRHNTSALWARSTSGRRATATRYEWSESVGRFEEQ